MIMEITRNVILDMLPLYLSDEVSADTRALVEEYLETDPALAKIAKQPTAIALPNDIPIPLSKEDKMEAYREAKRLMSRRIVILAVVIAFALLAFMGTLVLLVFFTISA